MQDNKIQRTRPDSPTNQGKELPLAVNNLEKYFEREAGIISKLYDAITGKDPTYVKAVDGVSLELPDNQVQGVIGESGCGKTTLLELVAGLQTPTGGSIYFKNKDVSEFSKSDWKEYYRNVQIIFQDPFNAMNPKYTVRETLREPLNIHGMDNKEDRIYQMLQKVQLNPPDAYMDKMPNQLSGGEKQRVSIARALILEPEILLADEPVSMLDVSTQAAILNLLDTLIEEMDMSMLYISHDLSTVSYICDSVNVMYLGRIIERAETREILSNPKHPYTRALINAIPVPDAGAQREKTAIDTTPPEPDNIPKGCRFKDRCPERMEICDATPKFVQTSQRHWTACHLHYDHTTETHDVNNE